MPDNAARTMRQGRDRIAKGDASLLVRAYNVAKNLWLTAPIWPVKHDTNMGVCLDMNDKSKPALSLVTHQARYHFTQADQVNQLVGASEADPDRGFIAGMMAICSLPRTNPGNRLQYKRVNGPFKLIMIAGGDNKLPYGNLPRLILAWVCTEAVRTQSRTLFLGPSLANFMKILGVYSSGGGNAGIKLRNQMRRLFGCTVTLIYKEGNEEQFVNSPIAARGKYWWNPDNNSAPPGWNSTIVIGEDLFNEIINHPVPLDMNTLKALKRCSLGLDLYLWLTYRMFALQRPLQLSWRQLYRQFDANPAQAPHKRAVQDFRRKVLRELKKIKLAWTDLNYTTAPGVLILHPSTPAIAPLNQISRLPASQRSAIGPSHGGLDS